MVSSREIKVGAFVLAGLCVIAAVVFMIGEERRAFADKETFFSVFQDVQGLRRGSPVRMGGVDIGSVSEVAYGQNEKDNRIFVHMTVVATEARRIRKDSVASIAGKGLLGDKMIVITVGSPNQPALPPGAEIKSESSDDIAAMMSKLGEISGQVAKVVDNLERTTDSLSNAELHTDIRESMGSLSNVLGSVERGEGYIGKLMTDPAEARRISQTLQNLERVTAELQNTTQSVNQILARVRTGPGLAHEIIYSEQSSKAVSQFGGAAEEVGLTLKGIRDGNGLARGLLYGGGESAELARDLTDMSEDLKTIVSDLRAGKGTLGALLVDPSVYEDLKLVLGNVQRNKALRALVRYSIRQDGGTPRVEDPDPTPAPERRNARGASTSGTGSATLGETLETGARAIRNADD